MPRPILPLLVVLVALLTASPAPAATPDQVGEWGAVQQWPLVAVHSSLLSTGKVLVWDGFEDGPNSERLFDPVTGVLTPKPYARNLFCSGFSQLADGKLFIAGGHVTVNSGLRDSTIWDPTTETATRAVDLTNGRWYPTVTTLADGKALVFSGDNIQADDSPPGNPLSFKSSTVPEVYDPATNSYKRLTGAQVDTPLYPFMFVMPDGRVFDAGPDVRSRFLDPAGNGSLTLGPVSPFDGSSAAMYAPGKVMKSGTWSDPSFANLPVTGRTAVIDLNAPSPVWRETAPMAHPRSYETITMLPDGQALVSGGTSKSDGWNLANAVLPSELWSPDSETWTTMASQANGRGYHSTAVLLPDGRVLMAGGGQLPGYPVTNQTNAQIFSPPYLFKGPRPQIASAPTTVQHGSTFTVGTFQADSISKVSLVRLGSETHAFDQNQRFVPLSFTSTGGALQVSAPANANLAPPGYYMLFIVDANGVPSVSTMVRLPAASEDAVPPSAPGNLRAAGGVGLVDLAWDAASDNGSIRRYNVHRGTAPGFTPTSANRIAQPTGTSYTDSGVATGEHHYVVTAEDQAGNVGPASNEVRAKVAPDTAAPTVAITAPADGAVISGAVTVAATAADDVGVAGVQFRLDGQSLGGEDATAPYSTGWDTRLATNGGHTLTAVARDAGGNAKTSAAVAVTVTNTAAGPVMALAFNETSGSTVGDVSGKSNIGTISGATRTTAGKFGSALTFDGVNDMVSVADHGSLDLVGGMTLEAWVKPAVQSDWRTAILKETPGNLVYALYSSSAYGGNGVARPSSWIDAENVGTTTALPVGAWSHVATTYDRTSWRLYVNGAQVASRAYTAAIPVSTGMLRIGGNSIWGEWFSGQIDEVRVYDRALSALELAGDRDTPVGGAPPLDTTPPSVSLTAPAAGATVSGSISLAASASDDVGVSGVQFKLDGQNAGAEDTTAPYSTSWDSRTVANGGHTVTAVARDAAGNTKTSTAVDVSVLNDVAAPAVSLTAPTDGASVSASVSVTADASDDVGVTGVQFRLDGQNLGGEDTTVPYATSWSSDTATNGAHTLTAVARDAAGNTRTSAAVTVTVANVDTTAPAVSVTAPADGASITGSVSVSATASDNVGVSGVQLKLDGQDIGGEDTSSPYSVTWDSRAVANGAHTITAVARDAAGNTRTSVAVGVTVANTASVGGQVAAYGFEETAGASVGDASGKGNIGSINGATRTSTGRFGGGLAFDGVNDFVSVPDANSLDLTGAMTLEAWARPTVQSDYRTAILKETTGNLVYGLYSSSAFGGNSVARPSAWLGAQGLGATTALPVGAWSHIATTYDRSTWRFYLNGVQVASKAYNKLIATSSGSLRIGGNSIWGEWFAGQLDEVRVYNRALTALEVAADRDRPVP